MRRNFKLIVKMSTNRGIFESFPSQPAKGQDSPFSVAKEPTEPRKDSPFTVIDDAAEASTGEFGKPVKIPEPRKTESPFQVAEPSEGFGFEAPAKADGSSSSPSPFGASTFEAAPAASPFSMPQSSSATPSPFSVDPTPSSSPVSASTQAALAAFSKADEPAPEPFTPAPVPAAFAAPASAPAFAQAPSPAPAPAAKTVVDESNSDSFSIRQLELRAIFGVDREMTTDEIMQRTRALPGLRNIARVRSIDMSTIEGLKTLLPNLGFGSGTLKLYSGSVPLEFIREGDVMLAVQTDGGFAPGVRETLMIVARELNRTN